MRLFFLFVASVAASLSPLVRRASSQCAVGKFVNPILALPTANPYVINAGGYWYMTSTLADQGGIYVYRSKMLHTFVNSTTFEIFRAPTGSLISSPELHLFAANPYVYYTLTSTGPPTINVLRAITPNPLGPYRPLGPLLPGSDPTILQYSGSVYLIYSAPTNTTSTGLYLVSLNDPITLSSSPILIASPTEPWENASLVGPQVVISNGQTASIAYSAGGSIGLLVLHGSPSSQSGWTKMKKPIWAGSAKTPMGTGSFVTSNTDDWGVFAVGGIPWLQMVNLSGDGTVKVNAKEGRGCVVWPAMDGMGILDGY